MAFKRNVHNRAILQKEVALKKQHEAIFFKTNDKVSYTYSRPELEFGEICNNPLIMDKYRKFRDKYVNQYHHYSRDQLEFRDIRNNAIPNAMWPNQENTIELKTNLIQAALNLIAYDGNMSDLYIIRYQHSFLNFNITSLLIGYIYLRKYLIKIGQKNLNSLLLIKHYLSCCIIAQKYNDDVRIFNDFAISGWGFSVKEINYFEKHILRTLNYDLFVSCREIFRYLVSNRFICRSKNELKSIFYHVMGKS